MTDEVKTGQETLLEEWKAIPEDKRGPGRDPDKEGDVQAHGPWVRVRCCCCHAINVVDLAYSGFWCCRCGAWNSKW